MITKPKKYTQDFVQNEVLSMLQEIKEDATIFYLGQLFEKRDYSMQRYSEWRKEYKEIEEISEAMKQIGEILETRVVVGAMKKELHPTITVFHLKNNYKWSDKVEIDQKTTNFTMLQVKEMHEMSDNELLALVNE